MASSKILAVFCLVGSAAVTAQQRSAIDPRGFDVRLRVQEDRSQVAQRAPLVGSGSVETRTQVPILKFIDRHNDDGSYTYGYESADGTYKIETRLATGEVRGKYGYYDPTGTLREAEYGASSQGGFEPRISGVILPDVRAAALQSNSVEETPAQITRSQEKERSAAIESDIRVVNGRRAILKKRPKKIEDSQPVDQPAQQLQQQQQLTREQQLAALARARQELETLQQQQLQQILSAQRQQQPQLTRTTASKSFGFDNFQRSQQPTAGNTAGQAQGVNMNDGSYTLITNL